MRAGAYTIHQSLTADAAAVLKLALGLARRRGHAQVTPLHVAFALLTASSSPPPEGLLRRACLRAHPGGAAHPLQCRALELCFNVALNRLPTSAAAAPHSSTFASSLIPTLSNALVAALKRAQANQRRGCVELHHQQQAASSSSSTHQSQQQPVLAIKVELEQLVISILDDPSVSRVMREAGFSSATVKTNIEEASFSSSSPPPPPPPTQSIPPHLFPAQQDDDDDVRAVMDVMLRKRGGGGSTSPVVVGDSAWAAESVAGELLRRLERGDVPEDLAGAHLLKLHLSYVHVRLMTRADVAARAAELRRAVSSSSSSSRTSTGLVVFVGDLRWAVHDDEAHHRDRQAAYSPVDHMVAELGRLLDDVRAAGGRAWLVATASYQTYMRWRRSPATWALQAVLVPTAGGTGLALNNHHPSSSASAAAAVQPAMETMMQSSPFARDEALVLCSECGRNFEREASLVNKSSQGADARPSLPAWLLPAQQPHHKDAKYLLELRRKWSRLCRKLHLCVVDPPASPWWPGCGPCAPPPSSRPTVVDLLGLEGLMAAHGNSSTERSTPPARWGVGEPDVAVGTTLALGGCLLPLSDTASSGGARAGPAGSGGAGASELERRLRRNFPWQPAAVAAEIAEAVKDADESKGAVWLYVKGGDHAAVLRAAAVVAADRAVIVCGDASGFGCAAELCSDVAARASETGAGKSLVLVLGDVERAAEDVVGCLVAASSSGSIKDPSATGRELDLAGSVVILATAKLSTSGACGEVIGLRLWSEETARGDRKRKADAEPSPKRPRHDHDTNGFDLNVDLCGAADDINDDEAVPSDLTHEGSSVEDDDERGHRLLQSVAAVVTLDDDERAIRGHLRAVLARALGTAARVEDEAVEALAAASGRFLEDTLERWAAEVLRPAATVATSNGGKEGNAVVLGVGGAPGQATAGFMGSVLPGRLHVD